MSTLPSYCVLVRTWFGADDAWEALVREVATPTEEEFLPNVQPVDDRAFEGLSAEGLKEKQPDAANVSFLADETTLRGPGHPILAVWLRRRDSDRRAPFRVAAAVLWSVENNINLSNMDWEDFTRAVDEDGVFRGF